MQMVTEAEGLVMGKHLFWWRTHRSLNRVTAELSGAADGGRRGHMGKHPTLISIHQKT